MSSVVAVPAESRGPRDSGVGRLSRLSVGERNEVDERDDRPGVANSPGSPRLSEADRHRAAVSRSLRWALESADRGDYADALGWIDVVEAIGERIPSSHQTKRQAWCDALAKSRSQPPAPSPTRSPLLP